MCSSDLIYWLHWVSVAVWLSLVMANKWYSLVVGGGGGELQNMSSKCAGLVVVVQGLSCSEACGIFPDQGLNLCLLHWQGGPLPLSQQGSLHFF